MSLVVIVGHQGAGKKSVLEGISDRLKKSTTICCKPLDLAGEGANFDKNKDAILRDLRKGLKVIVVQNVEHLVAVLPHFLSSYAVQVFNIETDLDVVIERLKTSKDENTHLNDKEAASLKKTLKKTEADNVKLLAAAQAVLDEAAGSKKAADSDEKEGDESDKAGNQIVTIKNDGELAVTVDNMLVGIGFNADVDLPPRTPEELRAEHLQACSPQEYLKLTLYPELLPALEQLDSYRPADAVEWLALELYRKATEARKRNAELAKLQQVEASIREEVSKDYSVIGRI